jgi:hypothetical protein
MYQDPYEVVGTPENIAMEFVNGNISIVKQHIRDTEFLTHEGVKSFIKILEVMERDFPNEVESFKRIIKGE